MHPNESGGEEFWETEMVASRSATEQGYSTYLSLFSFPSLLGEPQAIDTPKKGLGISMLKKLVSMKPFAPAHRCTLHPATPMSKKQGAVHSNIYELPFVREFGTLRQACLPIHLCFKT